MKYMSITTFAGPKKRRSSTAVALVTTWCMAVGAPAVSAGPAAGQQRSLGHRCANEVDGLFINTASQGPGRVAGARDPSATSDAGKPSAEEMVRKRGDQEESKHRRGEIVDAEASELNPAPAEQHDERRNEKRQ